MKRLLLFGALLGAALLFARPAHALTVVGPGFAVSVPVYAAVPPPPPPVYVAPAYVPAPVYVAPAPVYVPPRPVWVAGPVYRPHPWYPARPYPGPRWR